MALLEDTVDTLLGLIKSAGCGDAYNVVVVAVVNHASSIGRGICTTMFAVQVVLVIVTVVAWPL